MYGAAENKALHLLFHDIKCHECPDTLLNIAWKLIWGCGLRNVVEI